MRHTELLAFCNAHGFFSGRKRSIYEVVRRKFDKGDLKAYYVALTFPQYFTFINDKDKDHGKERH